MIWTWDWYLIGSRPEPLPSPYLDKYHMEWWWNENLKSAREKNSECETSFLRAEYPKLVARVAELESAIAETCDMCGGALGCKSNNGNKEWDCPLDKFGLRVK